MPAHGPQHGFRYAIVVIAAVLSVLTSLPSDVATKAFLDSCEDLLFAASNNDMFDIQTAFPPASLTVSNQRPVCDGAIGLGLPSFKVDLAPDGSHYGVILPTACNGNTRMWGRIEPAANNIGLNVPSPYYVPLGSLPPTYNWGTGSFLPTFPAPGQPFGYRFNVNSLNHLVNGDANKLQLYAIDAISPYREHLLIPDAFAGAPPPTSNKLANFGLGTVVAKDGSKVWYVTIDAIHELDLNIGPPAHKIMFLAVYHISQNATVIGSSQDGIIYLVDVSVLYRIDAIQALVDVVPFPPELGHGVDVGRYQCVPGGMRIEPHAELVTSEAGGTASFTAVLTAPPAQDVTVNFTSTDATEGTVSPASATFTSGNWNTPQTITVTGALDNDTVDQAYRITTSNLSSADPNFSGRVVLDVDVSNTHVNQLPSIASGSATAVQGSASATKTLGTASDFETAAGALGVATQSVPPGLTVGTVTNTGGTLTAPVAASCTAGTGAHAVTLRVTDPNTGTFDGDVTVTVLTNPAPTIGNFSASFAAGLGGATTLAPTAPPADNGSIASVTAAAPGFTGTFTGDPTTGAITASNAGPAGPHTVTVTATDNCGVTATRTFVLYVTGTFSDPSLSGGITAIRAEHVTELRTRIAALRARFNLPAFAWTDPTLIGIPIRAQHVVELRLALSQAFVGSGHTAPAFSDPTLTAGVTIVRAAHILELRAAVEALDASP